MNVGVTVVALALTVAACTSSEGSPTASPTPFSSPPSPSPSVSPSMSVAAELEAAARAFYTEATRAAATGDVSRLSALMASECSCQEIVRYIKDKWATGSLRGVRFVAETVGPAEIGRVHVVPVRRTVSAYEVLDQSGRVVERVPAQPARREDLYFIRVSNRWLIENVVVPR